MGSSGFDGVWVASHRVVLRSQVNGVVSGMVVMRQPDGAGFSLFEWLNQHPAGLQFHPDGQVSTTDPDLEVVGVQSVGLAPLAA